MGPEVVAGAGLDVDLADGPSNQLAPHRDLLARGELAGGEADG
jgi:hypothetical protein